MMDDTTKVMIENTLRERYPYAETICVTNINTSKKHGDSLVYFKAVATCNQQDFDNFELDEDGNYQQKVLYISGIKNGHLLTSKIENDDFDESDILDTKCSQKILG